jgi:ABC-type lipoprotein export system ATPase subunit
MTKIEKITLNNVLPQVFAGSEHDAPVSLSQVWLHNVLFEKGKSYMVEAESGTGKSSMCSFIYGNRRDYNGIIKFNERDTSTYNVAEWCEIRRRHLALLPQEMRLFAELTALENIMIKNRLTDRYSEKEIISLLGELEIDNKTNQLAARLSIGQQQRVAIVRTLCQPFDFIILDEPVSHLDARNNGIVASLITRVAKENGAGIITTSVGNPLLLEQAERVKL